jgi:hypothetical protein
MCELLPDLYNCFWFLKENIAFYNEEYSYCLKIPLNKQVNLNIYATADIINVTYIILLPFMSHLAFVTIIYGRAPLGAPPHVTLTQPSH